MNSLEIKKIIEKDDFAKEIFLGVYAIDNLPEIKTYPSGLIFNNQSIKEEGEHWLAIYFIDKNRCEFFDSFGRSPKKFENVYSFIHKFSNICMTNKFVIQNLNSSYCGLYCIYFLMLESRGLRMKDIQKLFSSKSSFNDYLISNLI